MKLMNSIHWLQIALFILYIYLVGFFTRSALCQPWRLVRVRPLHLEGQSPSGSSYPLYILKLVELLGCELPLLWMVVTHSQLLMPNHFWFFGPANIIHVLFDHGCHLNGWLGSTHPREFLAGNPPFYQSLGTKAREVQLCDKLLCPGSRGRPPLADWSSPARKIHCLC